MNYISDGGIMKSIKFWRTAIQQLSQPEMTKYQEAVQILLTWDIMKKEYLELDLLKRIIESEMHMKDASHKHPSFISLTKASSVRACSKNFSPSFPIEMNVNSQDV
jgi:hypothetical protein